MAQRSQTTDQKHAYMSISLSSEGVYNSFTPCFAIALFLFSWPPFSRAPDLRLRDEHCERSRGPFGVADVPWEASSGFRSCWCRSFSHTSAPGYSYTRRRFEGGSFSQTKAKLKLICQQIIIFNASVIGFISSCPWTVSPAVPQTWPVRLKGLHQT